MSILPEKAIRCILPKLDFSLKLSLRMLRNFVRSLTGPRRFFFSSAELTLLKEGEIPQHIAILMDGNRRWAKAKGYEEISKGHWAGAKVLFDIVSAAQEIGVKILTVYALSTENLQRSQEEVAIILKIMETYLKKKRKKMMKAGVKFSVIGHTEQLPQALKKEICKTVEATKNENAIEIVVAMNYGGRDEITRAIKKMIEACESGALTKEEITEDVIKKYLDTKVYPDPDLVIRTSNELRVSNFLLWQIAYSEFYHSATLWPDFRPKDLYQAVREYQLRARRMGK